MQHKITMSHHCCEGSHRNCSNSICCHLFSIWFLWSRVFLPCCNFRRQENEYCLLFTLLQCDDLHCCLVSVTAAGAITPNPILHQVRHTHSRLSHSIAMRQVRTTTVCSSRAKMRMFTSLVSGGRWNWNPGLSCKLQSWENVIFLGPKVTRHHFLQLYSRTRLTCIYYRI